MREAGLADFEVLGWFGLFAPAKTPPAIIDRIHRVIVAALQQPEMRRSLDDLGAMVIGNTPTEFASLVDAELKRWAGVVKAAGIAPQ